MISYCECHHPEPLSRASLAVPSGDKVDASKEPHCPVTSLLPTATLHGGLYDAQTGDCGMPEEVQCKEEAQGRPDSVPVPASWWAPAEEEAPVQKSRSEDSGAGPAQRVELGPGYRAGHFSILRAKRVLAQSRLGTGQSRRPGRLGRQN